MTAPKSYSSRILTTLPASGPPPVELGGPAPAGGATERVIVRFTEESGEQWVGTFPPGETRRSVVLPDVARPERLIVIAGGRGYLVDPEKREVLETFGGAISDVFWLSDKASVIFGDGRGFECHGPSGLRWKTRQISWDWMTDVQRTQDRLHGLAHDPASGECVAFEVDIDTGDVGGGSYPQEFPAP